MCGILVYYKMSDEDRKDFGEHLPKLKHRGPDDINTHINGQCSMGHTRLAIIDPEHASQPFTSDSRDLTAMLNGVIYNHRDLRREHGLGDLHSNGDGEVIIPLYEKYGKDFLNHLNGMFSIAVYDDGELLMARDRVGIKPLYYCERDDGICFSSEIKGLTRFGEDIRIFPKGHYWSSTEGFRSYTENAWARDGYLSEQAADKNAIREALETSVTKMLISDVPVGTFLSGGLDSALITTIAARQLDEMHTFSIAGFDSSDAAFAREIADKLGTTHHEVTYDYDEGFSLIEKAVYHLETFDPAILYAAPAKFMLARHASQHVKVVLSGQGADEVFGGYGYFGNENNCKKRFQDELLYRLNTLHFGILQSEDRLSMANALEVRVPFLDEKFLDHVMAIDPQCKFHKNGDIEKYILRDAFDGVLDDAVLWRKKEPFGDALGANWKTYLMQRADEVITDEELTFMQETFDHPPRHKVEAYYRRIYDKYYDHAKLPKTEKWQAWGHETGKTVHDTDVKAKAA